MKRQFTTKTLTDLSICFWLFSCRIALFGFRSWIL